MKQKITGTHTKTKNTKWTTFLYYSPLIRKITNIFKDTRLNISFRTTNTVQQQLSRRINNNTNTSGIYGLQCNTCHKVYIGQSG